MTASQAELNCRVVLAATMALAAGGLSGCAARHSAAISTGTAAATGVTVRPKPVPSRVVAARTDAKPLEQSDAGLAAALAGLAAEPSSRHHQRVASSYARLGVADAAIDHFDHALRFDRTDAASYEGRARVWRDAGLVALALGDAHRAVYHGPRSPSAHNTLGTVFQLMGRLDDARVEYEKALLLEPAAAYALNNLCYVTFAQGDAIGAGGLCRRALALQPDLKEARSNFALVLARDSSVDAVRQALAPETGAAAEYAVGVALFGNRRFAEAAEAFDRAAAMDPSIARAREDARRSRALARTSGD